MAAKKPPVAPLPPPAAAPPAAPRVASIGDVARLAGVSIATVSRIVNGNTRKAAPATVARVRATIAASGYRPTGAGQALRKGQSRLIAVLAANLANPAMAAIAASIETALRDVGLAMVLCDTHDRPDLQDEYLSEMRAQAVRATVLLGAVRSARLAGALEAEAPLLFVNRRCPIRKEAPFVGIDNIAAGAAVARALHAAFPAGRFAVIHGSLDSSATADRIASFQSTAARLGHTLAPGDVLTQAGLDHLAIGHEAAGRLLAAGKPPAAIFCASDLIAFGAHRRLREAGMRVPRDLCLVGFDDNPLNDWIAPWLASVRVPYAAFGPAIVDTLGRLWRGEKADPPLLDFDFVARGLPDGTRP
jgi:LacI family transcriptional regulator